MAEEIRAVKRRLDEDWMLFLQVFGDLLPRPPHRPLSLLLLAGSQRQVAATLICQDCRAGGRVLLADLLQPLQLAAWCRTNLPTCKADKKTELSHNPGLS